MSGTPRAPHRRSPPPVRSNARALLLPIVVALLAFAAAQPGPTLALEGPDRVLVGDAVVLTAVGVEEAEHTLRVVAPDGHARERTVTPVGGRLRLEIELDQPGRTVIWLEGPGLQARFTVPVEAVALGVVGPAGPAAEVPAPPTPGSDPVPTRPEGREEPRPAPGAPENPPATPDGEVTYRLEPDAVAALQADGGTRWRLPFPPAAGAPTIALRHLDRLWVALGHQVLGLDPLDGRIVQRIATSGRIVELRPVGTGLAVVSEVAAPGADLRVEARLENGVLNPPALFDASSGLFDALQREAQVGDPAARLAIDGTNPFLHLQAAVAAPTPTEREAETATAIASAGTFYDLARLARGFADQGWWGAADAAMAAAAADFRTRGYDPALLTSTEVHERYGFPLRPLQRALLRGDQAAADLWAPWLHALSGPDLAGVGSELRAYATALAERGDAAASALWRERAAERTNTQVGDLLARNALTLGRSGAVASGALLVAFLVLHLTLAVKYLRAQGLAQRQAREAGRRVPRWPLLRSLRFFGLTEKIVLLLMLASAYATIALVLWSQRGDPLAAAAATGHLGAPTATAVWSGARGDAAARAWVVAYLADRAGDGPAARAALAGVQGGGVERAQAALDAGHAVPAPSAGALRAAAAGTWTGAIADAFARPWALSDGHLVLFGLPAWTWPVQLVLFWLVVALHLIALLLPRPRYAAHAPRPFGYHLLALLAPGTGQADELYGVLLLVPWAIFGLDAIVQLLGGGSPLGIPFGAGIVVLAILYVVNAVAWAIELSSVRKRLADLRTSQPELARAFGLRPAVAAQESEPA